MSLAALHTPLLQYFRSLPLIMQDELAECGYACVAMICTYFGINLDIRILRQTYGPRQQGMSFADLVRLLADFGIHTVVLRLEVSMITTVARPAILHWRDNHFVVLKKVNKKFVVIHDPALGVCRYSHQEFGACFSGLVLIAEKSHKGFNTAAFKESLNLKNFLQILEGFKKYSLILFILSLSLELLSLTSPLFTQYLTDNVLGLGELQEVYIIALGLSLLMCLSGILEYLRSNMAVFFTVKLTEGFSAAVMRHLLRLPVTFFVSRSKGDLQSKFAAIAEIQKKISADFISIVLDGLMMLLNLSCMLVYSKFLSMIALAAIFLYATLRYLSYNNLQHHFGTAIKSHARVNSIFLETLHAILPIKCALKEDLRFKLWHKNYIKALNAELSSAHLQNIYHAAEHLISNTEYVLILCFGVQALRQNHLSLGMLLAFMSFRAVFSQKIILLIQKICDLRMVLLQVERVGDLVLAPPEIVSCGVVAHENLSGKMELRGLTFAYQDQILFKNLNLLIAAGEKIVIVGPSGCGKTTLLKIMLGLLLPSSGEIYVDDYLLNDFGTLKYRRMTAAVMQDDVLLAGSILENIIFFSDNFDRKLVHAVAQQACIHDTIMNLPMQYETLVGELGSLLSGGQKQRILLARALYQQPKFLFLDEASSHLDISNEMQINSNIAKLNITQIIVAHRPETIKMADRIIDLSHYQDKTNVP
jgi:ATP-binding cassette, subfamily B, bacterial CvaB/MchF/RaxB